MKREIVPNSYSSLNACQLTHPSVQLLRRVIAANVVMRTACELIVWAYK